MRRDAVWAPVACGVKRAEAVHVAPGAIASARQVVPLIENGCRYARSSVEVSVRPNGDSVDFLIRERDVEATLKALSEAGFRVVRPPEDWLVKVYDDDFMVDASADILIETARFWTSRARMEADGHAHIRGVIGPDEYHQTIDDNAYTNVMARWNLARAADVATMLQRERPSDWKLLSARLALQEDEPDAWRRVAAALVTGFHPDTGLFEQFEGYFGLEEVDVLWHRNGSMPIDVWLGPERTRRSKAIDSLAS